MNLSDRTNPCKAIWDDFMAHKISHEEFQTSVFAFALSDPNCHYAYSQTPPKPSELFEEELRIQTVAKSMADELEIRKAYARFYEKTKEKYKGFYLGLQERNAENASNLYFLREIYAFFRDKNPVLAAKAKDLILTHESGAYETMVNL